MTTIQSRTEKPNQITPAFLRRVCREKGGYGTPGLNEKLYLHFRSLTHIENLDEYTEVRCLWMESNAIGKIEGLAHMLQLRTLYLQQNCITRIEGLEALVHLDSINLSENFITRIEGLEKCTQLKTLHLSKNELQTADDLKHLVNCTSIMILDIGDNKIEDPCIVDDILIHLPDLRLLRLEGNPVVRKIPHYRKALIGKLRQLRHLDDMPVFDRERRLVDAWMRGGVEEEQRERERYAQEEKDRERRNYEAFENMIRETRAEQRLQGEQEEEQEEETGLEEEEEQEEQEGQMIDENEEEEEEEEEELVTDGAKQSEMDE